jgi:SAM-dependent methyltransferase
MPADARYFDALYATSDDPWGLDDRFYEQRKRALIMAALPRRRFTRAFEPGCAVGALTVLLAERCDSVLATDVAARAVGLTQERCRDLDGVLVEQAAFPQQPPSGQFDLVMLCEVGYYAGDLAELAGAVSAALAPGGVVVGCHWRHPADDHPQTAEDVHAALATGRHGIVRHVEKDFLLEVWSDSDSSVAQSEQIV